jgi:transcriptional regulator with XRE-family HTH domain
MIKDFPVTSGCSFGKWVESQREAKNLSKTICAKRAGMKVQRWAQIEYDESRRKDNSPPQPTRNTCAKIAAGLDLPLSIVLDAAGYVDQDDSDPLFDEQHRQELGQRIKARREYIGWQQDDLARHLGVSRETISNWERGTRGIGATTIPKIAQALSVDISYLYGIGEYAPGDVPDVMKRVWGMQGKAIKALPPGKARDRYLQKLEADAESYLDLARAMEERGQNPTESRPKHETDENSPDEP